MGHWRKQQHQERYFQKAKQRAIARDRPISCFRFRSVFAWSVAVTSSWTWARLRFLVTGCRRSGRRTGKIIALDLQPIEPIPGVVTIVGDMTDPVVQAQVIEAAGGRANVVLSDAAPSTTGVKLRDHVLSIELASAAFEVARELLVPKRVWLKVFEGEDLPDLIRAVKLAFHPVKVHTPAATRNESWESFIVARGFKRGRQMVPESLRLRNFLSHRETDLDLRGVHLASLVGENGAGKSALLMRSPGPCGGVPSSYGRDDDLVYHGESSLEVEFVFRMPYQSGAEQRCRILRRREPARGRRSVSSLLDFEVEREGSGGS